MSIPWYPPAQCPRPCDPTYHPQSGYATTWFSSWPVSEERFREIIREEIREALKELKP